MNLLNYNHQVKHNMKIYLIKIFIISNQTKIKKCKEIEISWINLANKLLIKEARRIKYKFNDIKILN
jgi:hypothetical protein